MAKKLKLIPEFKARQILNRPASDVDAIRWGAPLRYCKVMAEDLATRVNDSRRLFPWKFYRGDCHSHTQHSDGIGTVAETAEMAEAAGLDFQFVTDHWGVTQAPECRRHGLWVGQEPGTEYHHLGILGLDDAFEPRRDFVADFTAVRRLGGTPFIPHPAGWWPRTVYSDEQKSALWKLPSPFLMEVINGANNIVSAFDYTDQAAIELWDRLLMDGRVVHAMGNTDAHIPHGIGMVWNGVFAPRCDQPSILRALSAGRSFASEGPLLHLAIGKVGMGARLRQRDAAVPLRLTVVDSRGLASVRLVADGVVRRTWLLDGDAKFTDERKVAAGWKHYVRLEAISRDGRRGYSNPIYL